MQKKRLAPPEDGEIIKGSLINVLDIEEYTGIDSDVIIQAVKSGELPSTIVGKWHFFEPTDALRWAREYITAIPDKKTRAETAEILGFEVHTIAQYTTEGKIKSYRIGTSHYYTTSQIQEFLGTRQVPQTLDK